MPLSVRTDCVYDEGKTAERSEARQPTEKITGAQSQQLLHLSAATQNKTFQVLLNAGEVAESKRHDTSWALTLLTGPLASSSGCASHLATEGSMDEIRLTRPSY